MILVRIGAGVVAGALALTALPARADVLESIGNLTATLEGRPG